MNNHPASGTTALARGLALRVVLVGCAVSLVVPGSISAQAPPPAQDNSAQAKDLSIPYRFSERYHVPATPVEPGALDAYRVALRESWSSAVDNPRGAPENASATVQLIYSEAVTGTVAADERYINELVRRYETARVSPETKLNAARGYPPLEGLTIWYKRRTGGEIPEVISLTEGRSLWSDEHGFAVNLVCVPDLALALPEITRRIGETWKLSRPAVMALIGKPVRDSDITGKLVEVRPGTKGANSTAIMDISGRALSSMGDTALHAKLTFEFAPPAPLPAAAAAETTGPAQDPEGKVVEAKGAITKVNLAMTFSGPATDNENDRRKRNGRRELILERQLKPEGAPLAIPEKPPVATEANSWVVERQPAGFFYLRHPQELIATNATADTLFLHHRPPEGGHDSVNIFVWPQSNLQIDPVRKKLEATWKNEQEEVTPGESEWLPEADWPNLKVYHMSVALTPAQQGPRIYFNGYLVLTGREKGFFVETYTTQDPPTPFVQQVESMIKTLSFDPPPAPKKP
jgi:hypothetical protein